MLKQIYFAPLLVLALLSTAAAQESAPATQASTLAITAAATGDAVRITAPSSVVQMHVEVYAASGEKLFDQEIRGGNVFDWHLQDGQAQRLSAGAYVCVVTAKSVSGRITQKLGTVDVAEKSASVQAGSLQLSPQQTQAIGPVEADSSWTIVADGENQTTTVIANTGSEGQMIRGRGALSFRLGDFFSSKDQEQMRLTETGDLGIGTAEPKAKLDVAGTIRAQRFLIVKPTSLAGDSKTQTVNSALATDAVDSVQPLIAGTGTQNQIAKWTDNAGTLGDSRITETAGGNVGIGTTNPGQLLQLNSADGANSALAFSISGTVYGQWGIAGANNSLIAGSVLGDSVFRNNGGQNILFSTNSGSSAQLYLKNGGNVGIGNTNPFAKLDVAGDINTTTQFTLGGSRILSAPAGSGSLIAGVGAGLVSTGNRNSFFGSFSGSSNTTGQENAFFGRQSGVANLGGNDNTFIGESAGLNNNSGSLNAFVGAFAGSHNVTGQFNTTIGYLADVGSGALINATAIGANAQVSQSNSLVLGSINGTNFATTDTSVGIGTTAPASPFDVNGVGTQSGGVNSFSEVAARFRNRTAGTHSALSIDALSGQDAILYLAENGAAVWGIRNDSDQGGKFQIRLQSGGVNRPYFSLDSSGDVGIGTTTPNATLQVTSSITEQVLSATSNMTTGTWFNLGNTGTSGNTWSLISSGTSFSQGGPGKFYIRDNNASLVRAAIDTNGNLGIGTTAPNAKLHVVGGDVAITTQSYGVILRATDDGTGTKCFRLTVNSAGTLSTFAMACP